MIFLVHFDRRELTLREFKKYRDADREQAAADRYALEIFHINDLNTQEIVTLSARSEEDIRMSHANYFADYSQVN